MRAEDLTNPVVRAVVVAIRDSDRNAFFAAFATSATLTDDGEMQHLRAWADRELFRSHGRLDPEREGRDGLDVFGRFHSDKWDMETVWRFDVSDGLVHRLEVAAG